MRLSVSLKPCEQGLWVHGMETEASPRRVDGQSGLGCWSLGFRGLGLISGIYDDYIENLCGLVPVVTQALSPES